MEPQPPQWEHLKNVKYDIKNTLGVLSNSAGIISILKLCKTSDAGQSASCN